MAKHNEFGKQGEELAAQFLMEKGYEILERNWRNRHKEIDIIAKDGEELVIVEVKTRKSAQTLIFSIMDWIATPVSTSFPSFSRMGSL